MKLKLYYHPFASFCQKALIALYEKEVAFEPVLVDLGDPPSAAMLKSIWPIRKFPVLVDEASGLTLPESSVIIEYLDGLFPDGARLVPQDSERAVEARLWDRIFDQYVALNVTKIVVDRLRPAGSKDAIGVADAQAQMRTVYGLIEEQVAGKSWAIGDEFSLADCAAAPALFYANLVLPFQESHPAAAAYLQRLIERPSFARVIEEARPYRPLFPIPEAWEQPWVP